MNLIKSKLAHALVMLMSIVLIMHIEKVCLTINESDKCNILPTACSLIPYLKIDE